VIELLTTLGAAALSYVAFAWLALSQDEHWRALPGNAEQTAPAAHVMRRWRWRAARVLACAYALCLWGHGPGFGTVLWVLLSAAGAMAIAFTLSWRARWLRALAFQ
jgi:hypothetical protein